ncbi:hypothetical protein TeGR_g13865, partial [Tetraparma gracilis]
YGRREVLPHGLEGDAGDPVVATTLANDFAFAGFNAEKTTDLTTPQAGATAGPTGVSGGEGHYGLFIVGDANVENCNSTAVCCDTWDDATGSCGTVSVGCSSTVHPNPHYTNGEVTGGSRTVPDNLPGGEKWVGAYSDFVDAGLLATNMCGPALRLTSSDPRQSGSAWYQREQEVGEGFDTTFKFRISNPSLRCDVLDDVNTNCRSRGGDGFAFVVQEDSGQALGGAGADLGYGGVGNSVAIELDTYYNPELLEPYENHVSVHTRGGAGAGGNSAEQGYSLGATSAIRDLTDGEIDVRIKYEPTFNNRLLADPHFAVSPHASHFLSNADFPNGGQADWGVGLGTLSVYVENLHDPVLIVPLNLEATLDLNHGRAWVGFTAATGSNTWQVHDILEWQWRSLRSDKIGAYLRPPVVNGENAFGCKEAGDCKHK